MERGEDAFLAILKAYFFISLRFMCPCLNKIPLLRLYPLFDCFSSKLKTNKYSHANNSHSQAQTHTHAYVEIDQIQSTPFSCAFSNVFDNNHNEASFCLYSSS